MNDDLTFGATLLACLAAAAFTVWVEATSHSEPTDVAAAVVHTAGNAARSCATAVAAAPAAAE